MSDVLPDLGALYLEHRDSMHRVAASVLRDVGRASEADDVVQDAMVSILASPPADVDNWEALLITVVKRKALDRIRSAEVRRSGPELDLSRHDQPEETDIASDVAEALDRRNRAGIAWDALAVLDDRTRRVVWERAGLDRDRAAVAADLGVTPARVSQIVTSGLIQLRHEVERREGGDNG